MSEQHQFDPARFLQDVEASSILRAIANMGGDLPPELAVARDSLDQRISQGREILQGWAST